MDNTGRLIQAFQMQFDWVSILITNRERASSSEKKRAILFPIMQFCYVLVIFASLLSAVVSWALLFILQCCSMAIAVIYLALLEDYAESLTNAMGVEKNANLMFVAGISVRCFSTILAFICGSWFVLLCGLVEFGYNYYIASKNPLLVDATTVWKDIDRLRRDGRIRVGYGVCMLLLGIGQLVFRLVTD